MSYSGAISCFPIKKVFIWYVTMLEFNALHRGVTHRTAALHTSAIVKSENGFSAQIKINKRE